MKVGVCRQNFSFFTINRLNAMHECHAGDGNTILKLNLFAVKIFCCFLCFYLMVDVYTDKLGNAPEQVNNEFVSASLGSLGVTSGIGVFNTQCLSKIHSRIVSGGVS